MVMTNAYILTMSLAARTVSSPAKGEKWQTVLLIEIQVGNATPFSIFFFEFLNMSAVCLPPQTHCIQESWETNSSILALRKAQLLLWI